VSANNGINIVEDSRRLPRSVDEGISGIFRVGATKGGDEKTDEIDTFICRHLLSTSPSSYACGIMVVDPAYFAATPDKKGVSAL
jgi:hypothetical protein